MIIPFDRDEAGEWPDDAGMECEYPWAISEEGEGFLIPKIEKVKLTNPRTKGKFDYQTKKYLSRLKLSKELP